MELAGPVSALAALLLAAWMAQAAGGALLLGWTLVLLRRRQPEPAAPVPPVLVLVPVRGAGPGLDRFLGGLAAQDHPGPWRVVFGVESAEDPTHAALSRFAAAQAPPGRARVVAAGPAARRGQKVQNLLAALDAAAAPRPEEAAVVTLDADMVPPPDLLRRLLRPVLSGQAPIASGYRWSVPGNASPAAALVALADQGFAALPRCARCNLCWGGATAIGREALARLDLRAVWDRTLSDDLALTRAARAAGLVIYAPLDVRPPSPVEHATLREALAFGARQFRVLRLHAPRAWALALLAAAVPVAGGAAALASAVQGSPVAAAMIAAALGLQQLRRALRAAIARRVAPQAAPADAGTAALLQPLVPGFLLLCLLRGGLAGRGLDWAGRRYTLDATARVTRVERLPP
jgi:hypothetical protein